MATFVLLHGAGSDGWYWHLVAERLRSGGHHVVTPAFPADDDTAGLDAYVSVVVSACEGHADVVLVAQSLAGLVAPVACTLTPVDLLVLVCAMVPMPGETGGDWWTNVGHDQARAEFVEQTGITGEDPETLFTHDVPASLVAAAFEHVRPQSSTVFDAPCPLDAWPAVPTRAILGRHDRLFPLDWSRQVLADRLPGVPVDVIDTGHLPALVRPDDLASLLEQYLA